MEDDALELHAAIGGHSIEEDTGQEDGGCCDLDGVPDPWYQGDTGESSRARHNDAADQVDDGVGVEEGGDDAEPGADQAEAVHMVEIVQGQTYVRTVQ